ncbi:MAG: ribonuclease E/G, partial [Pseudomonadota bacterium]
LKDKLKNDRARIQVGRISAFGLLEMSRQRLRPGMLEATTQPCPYCHGTGLIRSDDSLALSILRQLEEEGTRRRTREVLLTAPVGIVNFIVNHKREYLAELEARYGLAIRLEADPSLVAPDYRIEKFKTATRRLPQTAPILSVDTALMDEVEEDEREDADDVAVAEDAAQDDAEGGGKKRRRRRRGGRGRRKGGVEAAEDSSDSADSPETGAPEDASTEPQVDAKGGAADDGEKPKRSRSRGGRGRNKNAGKSAADAASAADAETSGTVAGADEGNADAVEPAEPEQPEPAAPEQPEPAAAEQPDPAPAEPVEPVKKPRRRKKAPAAATVAPDAATDAAADTAETGSTPAGEQVAAADSPAEPAPAEDPAAGNPGTSDEPTAEPEPALATADRMPAPETKSDQEAKPKRRGWWSVGE